MAKAPSFIPAVPDTPRRVLFKPSPGGVRLALSNGRTVVGESSCLSTHGCCGVLGACCVPPGGGCEMLTASECAAVSGVFRPGRVCEVNPGDPRPCAGACCSPNGVCNIALGPSCLAPNIWHGYDTTCETVSCPVPPIPCCGQPCLGGTAPAATCYIPGPGPSFINRVSSWEADYYNASNCSFRLHFSNSVDDTGLTQDGPRCDYSATSGILTYGNFSGMTPYVRVVLAICADPPSIPSTPALYAYFGILGQSTQPEQLIKVQAVPCSGGTISGTAPTPTLPPFQGAGGCATIRNLTYNVALTVNPAQSCVSVTLESERTRRLLIPGVNFDAGGGIARAIATSAPCGKPDCGKPIIETRGGLL